MYATSVCASVVYASNGACKRRIRQCHLRKHLATENLRDIRQIKNVTFIAMATPNLAGEQRLTVRH